MKKKPSMREISDTIDDAKHYWPYDEGETLIPHSLVRLRELCHALEVLRDCLPCEPGNWVDGESYLLVLNGLRNGELLSRSYHTDTIIPYHSWSSIQAESEAEAYDSGFWYDLIRDDHDCHGFRGQLPIVIREDAEEWLRKTCSQEGQNHDRLESAAKVARRPKTRLEVEQHFKDYVASFTENEKPTVREREAWGRSMGLTRARLRKLVASFAPDHWRKPGAPKQNADQD